MRIAINGFGRIGRSVFRLLADDPYHQIVAINDLAPVEALAYLLRFDTVMGAFDGEVRVEDGVLHAGRHKSRLLQCTQVPDLPWRDLEVDIVVEATGRFRTRPALEEHLAAGAGKVLLTVPPKDDVDALVVLGVNDEALRPEHKLVSNASCTTNCLAPLVKVLDDEFGLVKGLMTTVHAYTNDQRLSDWYHADPRRSRAAGENTIPTTTGAARAVGKVLPRLKGKLDGMAMRVPVPNGSIVDLVAIVDRKTSVEAVNQAIKAAADGPMQGIVEYSTDAIVSSDIVGNRHSCIFDAPLTQVVAEKTVKVLAWYDNEWGYSNRLVDLLRRMDGGVK